MYSLVLKILEGVNFRRVNSKRKSLIERKTMRSKKRERIGEK